MKKNNTPLMPLIAILLSCNIQISQAQAVDPAISIDSSGNVGINIENPVSTLHVKGKTTLDGELSVKSQKAYFQHGVDIASSANIFASHSECKALKDKKETDCGEKDFCFLSHIHGRKDHATDCTLTFSQSQPYPHKAKWKLVSDNSDNNDCKAICTIFGPLVVEVPPTE
jgi:hypothetical protein